MESKLLFIVLLVFLIVIIVHRKREYFYTSSRCDTCNNLPIETPRGTPDCCNYFSIVSNDDYDLNDVYGPKCLNTCLVEHISKVQFQKAIDDEEVDILKYNREEQDEGFCHSHNVKTNAINACTGDCRTECANDTNCEVRNVGGSPVCVDKGLNYLSGGSVLNSTKCSFDNSSGKGCVNKYMSSIQTLKDIYDEEKERQESSECGS